MSRQSRQSEFAGRLRSGAEITGIFVKTPHPSVIELLAQTPLDFVVLDAEHAPFDAQALDTCLLAARAWDLPALVRVPALAGAAILQSLDLGAQGCLIPHVASADAARKAVRLSHYGPDGRGFSNSSRAGHYGGVGLPDHVSRARAETAVLCQIEDAAAIEAIDDIAAVDEIDCLFIGRADLAVAMGAGSLDDDAVAGAVSKVCETAQRAGRVLGLFLPAGVDRGPFRDAGVSMFVVGSDQALLKNAAAALADA